MRKKKRPISIFLRGRVEATRSKEKGDDLMSDKIIIIKNFPRQNPSSRKIDQGKVYSFPKSRFNSFYKNKQGKWILTFILREESHEYGNSAIEIKLFVSRFSLERETIKRVKQLMKSHLLYYQEECKVTGTVRMTKIQWDSFQIWIEDDEHFEIEPIREVKKHAFEIRGFLDSLFGSFRKGRRKARRQQEGKTTRHIKRKRKRPVRPNGALERLIEKGK